MADKMMSERLQPSLLDRLTDDDPNNTAESREARVIDIRRLRDIVQRDLSWLLNTNNSDTWIETTRFPLASKSVLNYGVREVAEIGGGLGILMRPAQARGQPSFAEYRFLVQPLPPPIQCDAAVSRRWRVELVRARRQFAERSVIVELSNGPDGLRVVADLGSATPAA